MSDARDSIELVLRRHLPVETPDGPVLCICDVTQTYDGPVAHRLHVADALLARLLAHVHCDGDPEECSVQALQGEYEEVKAQLEALRASIASARKVPRLPLTITATATGHTTDGVLVGILASDLDALENAVHMLGSTADTDARDRHGTTP